MGRGTRSHSEATTRLDLSRRASAGVVPSWALASRHQRRLLDAPAIGSTVEVDARILAGVVSEMRAELPQLSLDAGARDAWQALLGRSEPYRVLVHALRPRPVSFSDGRRASALSPGDDIFVIAPELTGEYPIALPARRLGLSVLDGLPDSVGEPAE